MSSASLFARSVARISFAKVLQTPTLVRVGAVRHSSYFTPAKQSNFSVFPRKIRDGVIDTIAHEYIKVDGKVGTVGITDFAQSALGDIVFVDLPEVGDEFDKGDSFGSVESVKAASDVYAPVSGTVLEVNVNLSDEPGLVNQDAEGDAWFIKLEISDESDLKGLLDPAKYREHCDKDL